MITVRQLIWEQANIDHIKRHEVTQQEVEEICYNNPVILSGHSNRLMCIGFTKSGRALIVILDPEPIKDVYYPVTARSADRKERLYYNKQRGGKNDQ